MPIIFDFSFPRNIKSFEKNEIVESSVVLNNGSNIYHGSTLSSFPLISSGFFYKVRSENPSVSPIKLIYSFDIFYYPLIKINYGYRIRFPQKRYKYFRLFRGDINKAFYNFRLVRKTVNQIRK